MLKEKPKDLEQFQEDVCVGCKYNHCAAVEACVDAWDIAQACYIEWKQQQLLSPILNILK